MTTKSEPVAEAYYAATLTTDHLLDQLTERSQEITADPHWGHVGDRSVANRKLLEALAALGDRSARIELEGAPAARCGLCSARIENGYCGLCDGEGI